MQQEELGKYLSIDLSAEEILRTKKLIEEICADYGCGK